MTGPALPARLTSVLIPPLTTQERQDAQRVRAVRTERTDCMRLSQQAAQWIGPSFLRKRHAEHEAHSYLLLRWHGR